MRRIGLPVTGERPVSAFLLAGVGNPDGEVSLGLDGTAALDNGRGEGDGDRRPGCAILPIPGLVGGGTPCPQVGGDSTRDVGSGLEAIPAGVPVVEVQHLPAVHEPCEGSGQGGLPGAGIAVDRDDRDGTRCSRGFAVGRGRGSLPRQRAQVRGEVAGGLIGPNGQRHGDTSTDSRPRLAPV